MIQKILFIVIFLDLLFKNLIIFSQVMGEKSENESYKRELLKRERELMEIQTNMILEQSRLPDKPLHYVHLPDLKQDIYYAKRVKKPRKKCR